MQAEMVTYGTRRDRLCLSSRATSPALIFHLESLLGQFGRLQQRIDVTQNEMLNSHRKRLEIHSKQVELLEKAAKGKG